MDTAYNLVKSYMIRSIHDVPGIAMVLDELENMEYASVPKGVIDAYNQLTGYESLQVMKEVVDHLIKNYSMEVM